jgi:hypothetical protein
MSEVKIPNLELGSNVIIEAGHIYTHETPGLEHTVGAEMGAKAVEFAQSLGCDVEKWLFIDNYNPQFEGKPIVLDETGYKEQIAKLGFMPDKTLYEADMVEAAKDFIGFLKSKGYAGRSTDGKSIMLFKKKIRLYDVNEGKYSCSLLDACLYKLKLESADGAITVLDKFYTPQQKATMTILKKMGICTENIAPFYYSTPGGVVHASSNPEGIFIESAEEAEPAVKNIVQLMKCFASLLKNSGLNEFGGLEVLKHVP